MRCARSAGTSSTRTQPSRVEPGQLRERTHAPRRQSPRPWCTSLMGSHWCIALRTTGARFAHAHFVRGYTWQFAGSGPREPAPEAGARMLPTPIASTPVQTLLRTPLFDRHVAAGGRMVPFAGWEMPVQYQGVIPEHLAVRTHAGLFDVSHMGQLEVRGAGAVPFVQRMLSNDIDRIEAGRA